VTDPSTPARPATRTRRANDDVEAGLLEAVETILHLDDVRPDSGFFDIGGHSLAALELAAAITARFEVDVPLRTIFESPTLRDLAAAIARLRSEEGHVAVAPTRLDAGHSGRREDVVLPLSPQQRRYYEASLEPADGPWNTIGTSFELENGLSEPVFRRSVELLAARHPTLGMALVESEGELRNVFRFETPLPVKMAERRRSLSVDAWPLWRFACHRGEGDRRRVNIWCHHMVSDAVSLKVAAEDLAGALRALSDGREPEFAPGPTYVDSVRERVERYPRLLAERDYWRRVFDAPFVTYELSEPAEPAREPATEVEEPFAADMVSSVMTSAARHGVSPFVVVMTAFFDSIAAVTGDDDVTIGMISSGRTLKERRVVGNLVNLVPVRRRDLARERRHSLGATAEAIRRALEHEEYQFTDIARDLRLDPSGDRFPITNVFVNQFVRGAAAPTESRAAPTGYGVKFDLDFTLGHFRGGLTATWIFRDSLQSLVAELRESFWMLISALSDGTKARRGREQEWSAARPSS
jgi:acyl carrier protein